jgi:methylenetetrahydrofolate dehydrogenase (NADP+)/methenyltetrahydrofolate cyclohydrolase
LALVIDGKAVAADVRASVKAEVAALDRAPGLATVLVGDDPASQVYIRNKIKACEEVGIQSIHHGLADATPQDELLERIAELNADDAVDGMLVQLPVPEQIAEPLIAARIHPDKDVDGFSPVNLGRLVRGEPELVPCTPSGVMHLLDEAEVPLVGARAVVVGRSLIVGKPVALLLTAEHATVSVAHSRTRDLPGLCREADVLVVAIGRPEMVRGDWIKPGAAVIDVGVNRTEDGLRGDVAGDEAAERAGWLSPVPGGVGPMTIAFLLANTLRAAERRADGN